MKKIVILFISVILMCCDDNEAWPVETPADTEAAMPGKWIIEITKIDTSEAGLAESKVSLGRYDTQISLSNASNNAFKTLDWKGQFFPYQFTAMIQGDNFIADKGSHRLVGIFSDYNNWIGFREYTFTKNENGVKRTYGFKATFTAKRKM